MLGFVVVVAALCIAASARRVKIVVSVEDPSPVLAAVRRGMAVAPAVGATRELAVGSELQALLEAWSAAPSHDALVAQLNEHLSDVGDQLTRSSSVPKAAARIAATTGALGAILAVIQMLGAGPASAAATFGMLAIGFSGALICVLLGRKAERIADERRTGYNDLARVLSRRLPAQES